LPEFAQGNIQMLSRANDEVRNADARIQALNQQASYLEAQLANIDPRAPAVTETGKTIMNPSDRLRSIREQYVGQLSLYTPKHPGVASLKREIYGLELQVGGGSSAIAVIEQLEDAYSRLAETRARNPADLAEVQSLEQEVGQLGTRVKNLPIRGSGISGATAEADNPAYLAIKNQLQATASERASLLTRRNQLLAQIADLEQRQLRAPIVERDYAALVRELQGEQAKFAEVRQKLLDAQLSQNLESEQKGERFTLIEPPIQPLEPIRPNRPAIFGIGFVLALGAAVAILVLLETVDTRVRGRKKLELMLGAAPLAVIPWVADEPPQDRFRFWKRTTSVPANGVAS
jgi:succinoglycan biosynthesis transport protein ExoP